MVTLGTIIPVPEQRDWFSALDLQDAYFHITIHPIHRLFLRLTVGHKHYQCRLLPFGLFTAPRVFSKTLTVVAVHLRKQGIVFFPYLDDCLLKGPNWIAMTEIAQRTTALFQTLGLQLNIQKSTLIPTQQLDFIQFNEHIYSVQARVCLPQTRFLGIKNLIETVYTSS
ncbi:unnamed protein product [Lepidochelys olivacea]